MSAPNGCFVQFTAILLFAWTWSITVHDASAVAIAHGDGTGNTSAPPDDPGWANVGRYGDFTAVYLGNQWALAADHVPYATDIVFDDQAFAVQPGSEITLRNPLLSELPDERQWIADEAPGLTEFTDLRLVRLQSDPALPPLTIAVEPPPFLETDADVIMIGNGRNRQPSLTTWQVYDLGGGQLEWDESAGEAPYSASGYKYAAGQSQRWGTNTIVADALFQSDDRDVVSLVTQFNRDDEWATEFESQAALGDSGGPVFYKTDQDWELVGVMFLVVQADGQPLDTAVLANKTVSADLSIYRGQIEEIIARVLQAGDANQDFSFDQRDIVQVLQAGKYLTGELATWGEGDWDGAPSGTFGSPPAGNGLFDQRDIVAALQSNTYLSGPHAAVNDHAASGVRDGFSALDGHPRFYVPIPEPPSVALAWLAIFGVAAFSRPSRGRREPLVLA